MYGTPVKILPSLCTAACHVLAVVYINLLVEQTVEKHHSASFLLYLSNILRIKKYFVKLSLVLQKFTICKFLFWGGTGKAHILSDAYILMNV